jgi:hypothetical protein
MSKHHGYAFLQPGLAVLAHAAIIAHGGRSG